MGSKFPEGAVNGSRIGVICPAAGVAAARTATVSRNAPVKKTLRKLPLRVFMVPLLSDISDVAAPPPGRQEPGAAAVALVSSQLVPLVWHAVILEARP